MPPTRKLKVFLCHASEDKPKVRELYKKLATETWIQPWLDEEDLLPGQDFDLAIYKAARDADIIIICLSTISVKKEGYVNKEIRRALDVAEEKLEDTIYMIPLRLDDCQPSFERLKKLHWVDYFTPNAHEKLIKSLRLRAEVLQLQTSEQTRSASSNSESSDEELDLYKFIEIPKDKEVPYTFYIGKYPVTNAQYERFLNAPDFNNPVYWLEFPKFDENCQRIGDWGQEGLIWFREELKKSKSKVLFPDYWKDEDFGITNPNHPVVGISWYEANAYCEWLFQNWNMLSESKVNTSLKPQSIRLPLETEWQKAAGGITPQGRYVWDEMGKETTSLKEILRRANVRKSGIGKTTPVDAYPLGKSPYSVMDMSGNVGEWQANFYNKDHSWLSKRGGSWINNELNARVVARGESYQLNRDSSLGFRVVCALPNG
ncbi:MAG: SUMF1/EgtB/PvdO family nonheme iron enzyme [Anaerolineales bacterium]|nr:SUMF1/EgtB/PvdO family nonheme iron enzyme [Anaerolineales bacterium]